MDLLFLDVSCSGLAMTLNRIGAGGVFRFSAQARFSKLRSMKMAIPDALRYTRIPLAHGSGAIPAVGFGTLISDPEASRQATKTALDVGFRHFDCAERYRNEEAVGDAMQKAFQEGEVRREDVFVTTKLWNTNHRPERVKPAFSQSPAPENRRCRLLPRPYSLRLPARRRDGPKR